MLKTMITKHYRLLMTEINRRKRLKMMVFSVFRLFSSLEFKA